MPGKNGQNRNGVQNNSKTTLNHSERMKKFRAIKAKKKQTFRVPNSGEFEHLRRFVASYKQNEIAYNKIMNRKLAQEMAQQNNEPKQESVIEQVNQQKPETEIKNENTVVIEEPKAKEVPQNEVAEEKDLEMLNLEDIKIDESDLDDPALDEELEKLKQEMKKEEELKAQGIDPESVEDLDDPELEKELKELAQGAEEKLEGDALEEAFQKLSNEVDGETKDADTNDPELDDPDVNEDINRIEQEIKKEKDTAKLEESKTEVSVQTNETEEIDDIIVEDVKEKVEVSVQSNEIKLLGEEKVEKQKEPTLADDFEIVQNNSNGPEVIKIVEDESEKSIPKDTEEKQINPEPIKLDTHALFQQIENNVLNPQKANKVVAEPQPKGASKPKYSVPPIPGMNSTFKRENTNNAPKLTEEERQAKELADAKAMLERLRNDRTGTTQDRIDRNRMINYYQGVVNKYKSSDELLKDSLELAEKARREAKEREEREKQLKELENSKKNDIVKNKDNTSPVFENEPHEPIKVEPQPQPQAQPQPQPQVQQFDAFDDDDFIDGTKEDEFERKLAEQEAKEAVKKEAEKKAAEEAAKKAAKEAQKLEEAKQRENSVRANVFINNLKTFNGMYKVNLEPNNFALTVSDAWTLIRSGDDKKKADGQKMLGELFKSAIKPAFEIEKHASYNEHRLPDYTEIAKSANELLRSAMYGFTDMYHSPDTKNLFEATAFGGLNAKDIVALTEGESQWSMDQKSDEAWEIQSKDAKNLADKWLSGDKPYEKMISEMKALAKADKDGVVDRKEILTKLTAAEWLLVNNDKMMIDDPEDPLNKLPNWGNRYWKALTEAREALGIDKHTSMRDLIQSDYAASAKAVISSAYNEAQIEDYVLDSAAREIYDSMEIQKEQFATQSAAVTLTDSQIDKNAEEIEMTGVRFPHPVPELDERTIMQHQPKNYDFVIEPQTELNLTAKNQTQAK